MSFEVLPIDIKRMMLLKFIEKDSDFLNIALSCKAWYSACCDVKFPVRQAEVYLDSEMFYMTINDYEEKNKLSSKQIPFRFTQKTCSRILETFFVPPEFYTENTKVLKKGTSLQGHVLEFAIKFFSEHRLREIKFDMKNGNDVDIASLLLEYPMRLRCQQLEIVNATVVQIQELTRRIEATSYSLKVSENEQLGKMEWHPSMIQSCGYFNVSGFAWDPNFLDLNCYSIEFNYVEGCGLTIQDLKQWAKKTVCTSSSLERLKVTGLKCTKDELIDVISILGESAVKEVESIHGYGIMMAMPQVLVNLHSSTEGKNMRIDYYRSSHGSRYYDMELTPKIAMGICERRRYDRSKKPVKRDVIVTID